MLIFSQETLQRLLDLLVRPCSWCTCCLQHSVAALTTALSAPTLPHTMSCNSYSGLYKGEGAACARAETWVLERGKLPSIGKKLPLPLHVTHILSRGNARCAVSAGDQVSIGKCMINRGPGDGEGSNLSNLTYRLHAHERHHQAV